MAMLAIPSRITQHTLVAVTLLCCGVFAPLLLLMRTALGVPALVIGTSLLGAGCSCVICAAFSRCFDRSKCSALQWRLIMVSPWLLNPVFVSIAASQCNCGIASAVWWSAVPLGAATVVFSGCLRLVDGDPDWQQESCPPRMSFLTHWVFSRLLCIALPLCLVSFQIALYFPVRAPLPQGAEVGFCVCGMCSLVGAKFLTTCACLAHERLAQAFAVAVFLLADALSALHLVGLFSDETQAKILFSLLPVFGIVQLCIALNRLSLRSRWSRVLACRRAGARDFASNSSTPGADMELGAHINAGVNREIGLPAESSDSDDERGPGSLPDGFYEALICVLGVPPPRSASDRRQFLCGLRSAVVNTGPNRAGAPAQVVSPEGNSAVVSTQKPLAEVTSSTAPANDNAIAPEEPPPLLSKPPIEIQSDDRVCTVCQDEIRTGDLIRPLPKCSHIFHADCLERWAKTMREATRCPTCRRPALARHAAEGAVSIQDLTIARGDASDSSSTSNRSRSADASVSRANTGTNRSGARAGRGGASVSRSVSAGRGGRVPRAVSGGRQGGGGRRGAPPTGQPGTRLARQQTESQDNARSPAAATLSASLGVSEAMAIAALECSAGAPDVAAHMLLEHKGILQTAYRPLPTSMMNVPDGVAEALVKNNPDLVNCKAALQSQLSALYGSGRLPATPWAELTTTGRITVFRAALEDVARKLESRGA
eukprot:TRINITY_DN3354_c0_g1_i4.p1 TRINITY_DN3354_c0_g1~~TRINITY_DN3354_c0_g1_i4.p1  ORF type:complete len:711 (-),score=59.66 TRINITY_DN3354_c0_g1_i4:202-2334(-)